MCFLLVLRQKKKSIYLVPCPHIQALPHTLSMRKMLDVCGDGRPFFYSHNQARLRPDRVELER